MKTGTFVVSSVVALMTLGCCGFCKDTVGELTGGGATTYSFNEITFELPGEYEELPGYSMPEGAPYFSDYVGNSDKSILVRYRRDEMDMPKKTETEITVDMTTPANLHSFAWTYSLNATGAMDFAYDPIEDMAADELARGGFTGGSFGFYELSPGQQEIQGYRYEYILFVSKAPNLVFLVSIVSKDDDPETIEPVASLIRETIEFGAGD
ncbi:MAG: hypothetical protein JSW52_06430 [Candidatus Coatesbacteria bacterium]|nr:MAG: hypothetical protein JSW52_06430 [Candidatus Coatesbacteria bacterium]